MDIKKVKPEWLLYQLNAGRDIKHIADYLGSSRREVTGLLKAYGIMEDEPATVRKRRKVNHIIPFEDVKVHDVVVRGGTTHSVIERTPRTITVRVHAKAGGTRKLTKKKWLDERWKIRIENDRVICYNLSDVPDGAEILAGVSISEDPAEVFGRSFENAMRGLVK